MVHHLQQMEPVAVAVLLQLVVIAYQVLVEPAVLMFGLILLEHLHNVLVVAAVAGLMSLVPAVLAVVVLEQDTHPAAQSLLLELH